MIKKLISLLICAQFLLTPVFAAKTGFADYDFSDEAQMRFEQNNQMIPSQNNDFSKRKERREIKNKNTTPITNEEIYSRTNYNPLVDIPQVITPNNREQPLYGTIVAVPKGTKFSATFDSGISSGSMDKNDRLTARLDRDWYYNGILLAPAGSLLYGTASSAKSAGLAYGSGHMEISFNQIMLPNGNMINISTEKIRLEAKSTRAKNISRDVLIGAATSLLVGALFTAIGGGDDWGRNLLVAGSVGAAGGGIRSLTQRGEDVYIPNGSNVEIILTEPVNISPYN